MDFMTKMKAWVRQYAPNLAENKYVGMVYDRFATLPPNQQKNLTLGILVGLGLFVALFLGNSILSISSKTGRVEDVHAMIGQLRQYQKQSTEKSTAMLQLERNKELIRKDALKNYLSNKGRRARIPQRWLKVSEQMMASQGEGSGPRMKRADITIERVNLNQLLDYLQEIEFGQYSVSVNSVRIDSDEKFRGYMNVTFAVTAPLFEMELEQ